MEDKHLYRETQWDVSAEEGRAIMGWSQSVLRSLS